MDKTKYDVPIGVPEFYKGRSIFVTGFTGYLGKLLVEKLLYSCPEIDKIYVLIRNKKSNHTTQGRFEEILQSGAFLRLREKYPGVLESKVIPLAGDMLGERLGLSHENEELLRNQVSVILHGAASVRFDDPLRDAIHMNLLGAKKIAELALTMPKLVSLTYISTAYTNCDHIHIKEELYPPKADWSKTLKICEKIDPASLEILHKKYTHNMVNTYVYSKSLAEHLVNDYRDRLPVVIVRPAIVVPSFKEPVPGWTDNKYGPIGLVLGSLLGLIRCSWVDIRQRCNYIMSDAVVNAIIIATWNNALTRNPQAVPDSTTVYNVCSPYQFNMNHDDFHHNYRSEDSLALINRDRIHFDIVVFYPKEWMFRLHNLYKHVLPSYFIDFMLTLSKRKPMLVSVRRKIFGAAVSLSYFTTRTFTFDTDNFDGMLDDLSPEDKETFGWVFNQSDYFFSYYHVYENVKKTILKPVFDDLDTIRKRLQMLYIFDRASVYLTYSLVAYVVYHFSLIQVVLSTLSSFVTLQ